MNTSPLAPLGTDWPQDRFEFPEPSLQDIAQLFSGGRNDDLKYLRQDPQGVGCIQSFATANGMTYVGNDQTLMPYTLQQDVHRQTPAWMANTLATGVRSVVANGVVGKLHGFDVAMFVRYAPIVETDSTANHDLNQQNGSLFRLEVGTKRTPQSTIRRDGGVIRVKLHKVFPQLLLDSNKNDKGRFSDVNATFKPEQRQSLEGDFDNYFDFYAPIGLQLNALTVLSPNFMQILKDSASAFNVEFFYDEMVLTTKDPLYTVKTMQTALAALEQQLKYLARLEASWNYQPLTPPFDRLQQSFVSGSILKVGGHRINFGLIAVILFVVVFVAVFALGE
jgi:hypothetical protein